MISSSRQRQTVFHATACSSLFSWKQFIIRQLLYSGFGISGIIKPVSVTGISRGWLFRILQNRPSINAGLKPQLSHTNTLRAGGVRLWSIHANDWRDKKITDDKLKYHVLNLLAASTQFPTSSVSLPEYSKNKQQGFTNLFLLYLTGTQFRDLGRQFFAGFYFRYLYMNRNKQTAYFKILHIYIVTHVWNLCLN